MRGTREWRRPSRARFRGMRNLPTGLLDDLREAASGFGRVSRLIVFGSYARGDACSTSDLDLCVMFHGTEDDTVDVISDVDVALHPVMRRYGLEYDLVGFPENESGHSQVRCGRPLLDRIEKEGVVVCHNS